MTAMDLAWSPQSSVTTCRATGFIHCGSAPELMKAGPGSDSPASAGPIEAADTPRPIKA